MAIDNRLLFRTLFLSFILVTGGKSGAQNISTTSSDEDSWERFSIRAGGFLASYNGGLQIASKQVGVGVLIDIEDGLGINSSTFAFRGAMDYKFGKNRRHQISAGYFGIFRNGSKILEEELEIGDVVYPVGEELNTKFNFTIIRAKYDYTFFQDNRVSLGASVGLFIVPMNLTITSVNLENHNTKFIAPLPLVGLRSNFKITDKLYLNQSAEFLYLTFENYTGSILDLQFAIEHHSFKNLGFGLGINSNRLKIKIEKEDSPINFYGNIGMDYTGLIAYVKYFF